MKWVGAGTVWALCACGSVSTQPADGSTPPQDGATDGSAPGDSGADAKMCTQTTCTGGVLEVCGTSGTVERTEQCALDCFSDGTRCNAVAPSNGLQAALDQAAEQGAVTLPDGTTIDTDAGTVVSAQGPIAVATTTVSQSGGAAIRVLIAKSWDIGDVRVSGALPVAFVASGDIVIRGVIDASADGPTAGPGARTCGTNNGGGNPAGSGHYERPPAGNSGGYPAFLWCQNGFGGGGFGSVGGTGGIQSASFPAGAGGQLNGNATLSPLRGGCEAAGGSPAYTGAGGGVVQLVSGSQVHLVASGADKGTVHVGGGAGHAGDLGKPSTDDPTPISAGGGGGSGGGILVEAPRVALDDGTALLAAGGGGGGYGACNPIASGLDAPPNGATPAGGDCPSATPAAAGGDGGTAGAGGNGENASSGSAGSGGGGLGRIRVNTADGQYTAAPGSLVRGTATTGTVGRR